METAQGLDPEASATLWRDIASTAESGWDFSTRWFADGESMETVRTTRLLPSDLNAYLYQVWGRLCVYVGKRGAEEGGGASMTGYVCRREGFNRNLSPRDGVHVHAVVAVVVVCALACMQWPRREGERNRGGARARERGSGGLGAEGKRRDISHTGSCRKILHQ